MYYLWLDNAQAGPFTLAQLAEKWQTRQVTALTLYWEEGNADWLPLHNISGLLEAPGTPAPPRPPSLPTTPPPARVVAAMPVEAIPSAAALSEEVVWKGNPSLWYWTISLFWGIVLTPVVIGIFILIYVFWSRGSTRYRVTNRRISLETGIFTRSSRELRVEDIRSITARSNIFGIGQIDFSSAARDEAEVMFWGVPGVEKVRDLVKQLQNQL